MKTLSSILKVVTAISFLIGFTGNLFADDVPTVDLQASPSVINLQALGENNVTIHADIPYSLVDTTSLKVYLEDSKKEVYEIPILATYEDGRLDLVIKTNWVDFLVSNKPAEGSATFTVDGSEKLVNPELAVSIFSGEDNVVIMDGAPKK